MSHMVSGVNAYLGLGGNVGDVLSNMRSALDMLDSNADVSIKKISKLYKTPPWGVEDQNWFLNACALVETRLTAPELLNLCLGTEKSLNRIRDVRWGPRTIDLDVLDYDNTPYKSDMLTLPHPRIAERAFVLVPLADIAPEFNLGGQTCAQMLSAIADVDIHVEIDSQTWWQ